MCLENSAVVEIGQRRWELFIGVWSLGRSGSGMKSNFQAQGQKAGSHHRTGGHRPGRPRSTHWHQGLEGSRWNTNKQYLVLQQNKFRTRHLFVSHGTELGPSSLLVLTLKICTSSRSNIRMESHGQVQTVTSIECSDPVWYYSSMSWAGVIDSELLHGTRYFHYSESLVPVSTNRLKNWHKPSAKYL